MNNKKITNSKARIQEILDYYGMSQTELCKKTGLQKSALSNYLSGDREPRQDQISLIVDPFNINPAWFMGYDAPMFWIPSDHDHADPGEKHLLVYYRRLNESGKHKVLDYAKDLFNNPQYGKGDFPDESSKTG